MANPFTALVIMRDYMTPVIKAGYKGQPPAFVQKGGDIYVQNRYQMSLKTFPAMHLEAGPQVHSRVSGGSNYVGQLQIIMSFFDRWDGSLQTIDTIRAGLDADVELVMATLQNNENLAYGGTAVATSMPRFAISPYKGEEDNTFSGLRLIYRTLTPAVNILPYD